MESDSEDVGGGWRAKQDASSGRRYLVHAASGTSKWDDEADSGGPREGEDVGGGWSAVRDAEGRTYYAHRQTRQVRWDRPDADAPAGTNKGLARPQPRPDDDDRRDTAEDGTATDGDTAADADWVAVVDALGRTYYAHRRTQQVQWARPAALAACGPAREADRAPSPPEAQHFTKGLRGVFGAAQCDDAGGAAKAAAAQEKPPLAQNPLTQNPLYRQAAHAAVGAPDAARAVTPRRGTPSKDEGGDAFSALRARWETPPRGPAGGRVESAVSKMTADSGDNLDDLDDVDDDVDYGHGDAGGDAGDGASTPRPAPRAPMPHARRAPALTRPPTYDPKSFGETATDGAWRARQLAQAARWRAVAARQRLELGPGGCATDRLVQPPRRRPRGDGDSVASSRSAASFAGSPRSRARSRSASRSRPRSASASRRRAESTRRGAEADAAPPPPPPPPRSRKACALLAAARRTAS
ncbi:hypothetical protein M885DRAFT_534009 [Pelagophyceae sp. CCMP2097]|nr:hypothetical protein M885DRAFT_534009 [Pelagophyceae sp. CCMP2097]